MVKIELHPTFRIRDYYRKYISNETDTTCDFAQEFLARFQVLATSTPQFEETRLWNEIALKLNKPFYNLLCCGFYGFFYAILGSSFQFTR